MSTIPQIFLRALGPFELLQVGGFVFVVTVHGRFVSLHLEQSAAERAMLLAFYRRIDNAGRNAE